MFTYYLVTIVGAATITKACMDLILWLDEGSRKTNHNKKRA